MTTLTRLRIALGTFVAVEAQARDTETAEAGIAAAFNAIATLDRLMHPTRHGSDLAALRTCRPERVLKVHQWTWQVLHLCQRLHRESRGAFDPCLSTAPGRMTDIELLPESSVSPRAAVHVDLGGIAKGYAVDQALDALRAEGCAGGLVNAGGDIAVFGALEHLIVCHGPRGMRVVVTLHDAALATSHTRGTSIPSEHRGYYHGVHRDTPVSGHATVIAPRAAVADALTKCVLCGGYAEAELRRELLQAFGARQLDYRSERQPHSQVEA